MTQTTKRRLSTWGTHLMHVCLGLTLICGCVIGPQGDQTATNLSWHSISDRQPDTEPKPAKTSRAALFRLQRELNRAYERFDLHPPHPAIRIVDADHDILKHRAIAVAAVTEQGEERIYFNRSVLNAGYSLQSTTRHEVAHLATWRAHGLDVRPHGPEFKTICWAATSRDDCTAQQAPMVGRF